MRVLGLLGGMSWESSIEYERIINEHIRAALGGANSADLIIRSFNFADIERLQEAGRWDDAGRLLAAEAMKLQVTGAEAIVLCTNTMHAVSDVIEASISVPLIHIADPTGDAIQTLGLSTVGLLGTRYTMEQDFYAARLRRNWNITVTVPDEPDRASVHRIIYDELVQGMVTERSRALYVEIIERLVANGAQGIIAGCTEIELLITQNDIDVPFFPTARLHAEAAATFSLS
jgi:aspartate racemase